MQNIDKEGVLGIIKRKYKWNNKFDAVPYITKMQKKKKLNEKDFEKMLFCKVDNNLQNTSATANILAVWDSCMAQGIKNDAEVTSFWNEVLGGEGCVDSSEKFIMLVLMQKARVKNKRQNKAMEDYNTSTKISRDISDGDEFETVKVELDFKLPQYRHKVHNFCNERDLNRFSCFISDTNNTYYIDEKKNCTAISFTSDGKVGVQDTDNKILDEINSRVFNDIEDANRELANITEFQLGVIGENPIADLFVESEVTSITGDKTLRKPMIPFYLLQTHDVYKVTQISRDEDGKEYTQFSGLKLDLKRTKDGKPLYEENRPNAHSIYILEHFKNYKSYVTYSGCTIPTFSNDENAVANIHLIEKENVCNGNEFVKLKPLPDELKNDEEKLRKFIKNNLNKNCPMIHRFFFGEDGNSPKCNDQSFFRIIYFDGIIFDANAHPAQFLCISDAGGTGKTHFAEMKRAYWNSKIRGFVSTLDKNIVNNPKSLYFSHPEKARVLEWQENGDVDMIHSDIFKRITSGGDEISTEKKFGSTFNIPTKHFISTMYTNNKPKLSEFALMRRCCPATMCINYKRKFNKEENDKFASELDNYFTLCRYYYEYTKMKEADGTYLVLCEEDYRRWLNGGLNMYSNLEKIYQRAFTMDDDLKQYFKVSDFSTTELGENMADVANFLFEFKDSNNDDETNEYKVWTYKIVDRIVGVVRQSSNESLCKLFVSVFGGEYNAKRTLDFNLQTSSKQWYSFKHFLERDLSLVCKQIKIGNINKNGVLGVRLRTLSEIEALAEESVIYKNPSHKEDYNEYLPKVPLETPVLM